MGGFAIGSKLNLGVPGGLTRQIDNVILAKPNKGATIIKFGDPVVIDTDGVQRWIDTTSVAADFIGIALRIVKTNETYGAQDAAYQINDTVDVLTRGAVAVCIDLAGTSKAEPVPGGKVYIRKADGKFVTEAESGNALEITNAIWASGLFGGAGTYMAEITLLTRKA